MNNKYIKMAFYAIAAVLTVVVLWYSYSGSKAELADNQDFAAVFGINVAGILAGLCALAWIVFSVIQMIDDTAKLKSSLIFLGILAVLFLVGYLTANGDLGKMYAENGIDTDTKSQLIGALLNLPIILGGAAVLIIIASEVKKAIS